MRFEKGSNVDILSVAIESGGFSDEDLVNQLMTFLVAGHETTAAALSWAVCMLCKYPDIQARLRNEIQAALPDPRQADTKISHSDIDGLPFLSAVCNEVLRLYPPIPITLRVAAHDTTILGNYVPRNTTVYLSPWAVNTSKALWGGDAREFVPDRWMGPGKANTGGSDSNFSNLTFLHGPRSCIGQSFAKAEFACLVAAWVGSFETEFAAEDFTVQVRNGIAAKPGELLVKLKAVEQW